ncbi:MAG TPA: hypothetical protein VM871_07410 [Flavisolibacter sp.]|jgi:mono/diheme cytochrome c family protein|nr:hypothetical protein [Flavisolibacter sp.]
MRRVNAAFILLLFGTAVGAMYACNSSSSKDPEKAPAPSQAEMVKRGEYLVASIGCDDCHSPKRMGPKGPEVIPELRLSGYPADRPLPPIDTNTLKKGWYLLGSDLTSAVGPWGVSFAANLTSDTTGIGGWTEQNFLTAIRHGKAKGLESNRDLLPPMPWYNFAKLTDDDLKAMFAYLKSTPPVVNVVPAPKSL